MKSLPLIAALFCLSLGACTRTVPPAPITTNAWLKDGVITLAGPVPAGAPAQLAETVTLDVAYGFVPTPEVSAKVLEIDTKTKRAWMKVGNRPVSDLELLDIQGLAPGDYKIAHKQRNPLWYAPVDYFTNRLLTVPEEGEKARYLRGAFGEYALFLSPTEAIHSGPFALQELHGARVEENELSKLFYSIEVGDLVRIK